MNADSGSEANGAARRTSGEQVVDLPGVQRGHRDDLLGQHVQGVGGDPQRLDGAGAHPLGDHRGLHQVAAVLREDHAGGDRARPGGPRGRRAAAREATDGGDSTWTTRSTAPMSMPSSRLEVATTAGSRPALRSSSTSARCSLETEPWWARAMTGGAPWRRARAWPISCGRGVRARRQGSRPVARS